MIIFNLFNELDQIIIRHFGELEDSLKTEQGRQIFDQLLLEENRSLLHEWYNRYPQLNLLAEEIKERLERELGEKL